MAWMWHARVRDLGAPLWIDEGISLGIADHPLTAIPGVLRQDGSPPLFYVLLHLWTGVFGAGIRSGHALSLTFAVLAIPAAAWAAAGVAGGFAGLATAAVVALDPFTGTYAIEVRMYSLLLLLGLLATGAFLRAFVLRPGSRRWSIAFAFALAAVLYTHNWGAFFGAAAGVVWLALVAAGPAGRRRGLLVGGAIGFGGALLLYAPWLPTLADQVAHTGAPWSHAPHARSIARSFQRILGGRMPEAVLLVVAAGGALELLRGGGPVGRRAVLASIGLCIGTFAVAFVWSNVSSPAWAMRYLAIVLAPLAVAVGIGLARMKALGAIALVVAFVAAWYGSPTHSSLAHKSNVGYVAGQLGPLVPPGTLVFSTQPEQVPLLAYSLQPGLRYATPLGPVRDPLVFDWRDAMNRLNQAQASTGLGAAIRRLRPGRRVMVIRPRFGRADAPWTRRIAVLTRRERRLLKRDTSIRLIRRVVPHRGYSRATVSGFVYEKVRGHGAARRVASP
jgi:hypothetical protein